MDLDELKAKPIWQMTGEELLFLLNNGLYQEQPMSDDGVTVTRYDFTDKKYVYGLRGLATIFGCSISTANRIKKSGIINKAITQIGRKIIINSEIALELAGEKIHGRRLKN